MAITDWPSAERPREKLLNKGADSLSDAELLAIFLRTGIRGKTAVDLSRDLLREFGGLRQLLEANKSRFCDYQGLGPAKYCLLQAALEMSKRYLASQLQRGASLTSSITTRQYLKARLRHRQNEVFACLFLDSQHRVLAFEEIFQGTIDAAAIYPREVVKRSLHYNAAAVILAHNHPSGVAEPSQADRHITRQLCDALALVDIRVLDHMIIGDGEVTSFAEQGLINN